MHLIRGEGEAGAAGIHAQKMCTWMHGKAGLRLSY